MTISLAGEPTFALGGVEVRPSTREMGAAGAVQLVEPRVMQVSTVLARRRGEVVSRDTLLAECWGGCVVTEDAVNRCIAIIRRLGKASGGYSITTVARVGYRLEEAAATSAPNRPGPTLAVLGFDNLTQDATRADFAEGLAEEIIARLSRFRSIIVAANGAIRSLKSHAITPQDAGRRLGARYLLEGSLREDGGRVRVAVKLIDASDGAQVWVERFEGPQGEVFALQDQVALAVAGAIVPTIRLAEVRRASAQPSDGATGYGLYLRALAIPIVTTPAALRQSLDLLERAIALDPGYGPAFSRAAMAYRNLCESGGSDDPVRDQAKAIDLAHRALAATGDDGDVLANAATVLARLGGDLTAAVALLDRARELNPGSAWVWYVSGRLRVSLGDSERGADQIRTSARLDPLSLLRPSQLQNLGLARFAQGRYDDALVLLLESAQLRANSWQTQCMLAACQGQLGQCDAGRASLARARAINARLEPSIFAEQILFDADQRRRFLDGIAAADEAPPETVRDGERDVAV